MSRTSNWHNSQINLNNLFSQWWTWIRIGGRSSQEWVVFHYGPAKVANEIERAGAGIPKEVKIEMGDEVDNVITWDWYLETVISNFTRRQMV